jgi:integrase
MLAAEDVDWKERTISYRRRKTGAPVIISFGTEAAEILRTLPESGQLFPALARIHERHRAKLFIKRLATVGITGVSLHSYRYAWAERAKENGYPERFAMQALGHSSKAVHRAYSKKAQVKLPSLEDYERKIVPLPKAGKSRVASPPERIHSYSSGEPWPLWRQVPVATTTVQRYLEPALCFLAERVR